MMDFLLEVLEALAILWKAIRKTVSEFNWGRRGGDGGEPPPKDRW